MLSSLARRYLTMTPPGERRLRVGPHSEVPPRTLFHYLDRRHHALTRPECVSATICGRRTGWQGELVERPSPAVDKVAEPSKGRMLSEAPLSETRLDDDWNSNAASDDSNHFKIRRVRGVDGRPLKVKERSVRAFRKQRLTRFSSRALEQSPRLRVAVVRPRVQ